MNEKKNEEKGVPPACLLSKSVRKSYVLRDCSTEAQKQDWRKKDKERAEKEYRLKCEEAINEGKVTLSLYGKGGIVNGLPSLFKARQGKREGVGNRKRIKDASQKSMRRLAFILATGCVNWWAIVTLTFRRKTGKERKALKDWCDAMPFDLKHNDRWAWVREYQGRGVVHYHVLLTQDAFIRDGWTSEEVTSWGFVGSGDKEREVLKGRLADWITTHWIHAVGDYSSEFLAFQRGGIIERVRDPAKMAGYMARYLGKEEQKRLPNDEPPGGRWWFVSPASFPVCQGTVNVESWDNERPINKLLFDCDSSGVDVWGLAAWQYDPLQDSRIRQALDATDSKTCYSENLAKLAQLKNTIK